MGKDFTTYRRRLRKVQAAMDTANREAGRPGRFTGEQREWMLDDVDEARARTDRTPGALDRGPEPLAALIVADQARADQSRARVRDALTQRQAGEAAVRRDPP